VSLALDFITEVTKLPTRQREVLVPLVAWSMSETHEGFVLDGELKGMVDAFIASLGDPEGWEDALNARLVDADITPALLQDLRARGKIPATAFETRRPPSAGEVQGGLLGMAALRAPTKTPETKR
jgi:hypothetical protein